MKVDTFTRVLLTIIAVALSVVAVRPLFSAPAVSAQTGGVRFGYLVPQGGMTHGNGGMEFIDMRSGNKYDCYQGGCRLEEHFALEQIK